MPIPKISNKKKNVQGWRSQKTPPKSKKKRKSLVNTSAYYSKKRKNKLNDIFSKKNFVIAFFVFVLIGVIFTSAVIAWYSKDLPEPGQLINRQVAQTTKIYDRTGENVLYEIHGEQQRTLIKLSELPDYVKFAAISIEDKNFYKHGGISPWGILRGVVWQKLRGRRAQGGSTLTQQFVKNAILSNERTIKRKIKEWILAYKMEKKYSKDEILEFYLNEIPYGSTAYGVEAASQKYFGKSAKKINIAEAAVLAALPQAPSYYSPFGSNKDKLIGRQRYIIGLMEEQGYISRTEAEEAKNYTLAFNEQSSNIVAPHFVLYVKELLSEKYGEKTVEQGGLKIITTLDLYKQEIAEKIIEEQGEKNEENYDATNASLVSIDPKTGQVLAMVGSRDYFNDDIDGKVNVALRPRQPGSSLKPLVYAASFIKGLSPDTILYDVVTNFSNDEAEPYEPHNYDDKEHGPVSIRKALQGSLNIPAVKAIYIAGIDNVLSLAHELGYSTLNDKDRYGLSLVLGGGEVKLVEHVNAYSAFAREGVMQPISYILKVEDKDGKTLEEFEENKKAVLDPKIARIINNVLSDNEARSYAFGKNNWLTLGGRPVAAKTGTTNDYRDAWTIGYTPSIVTGVWVGNNNNEAMKRGAAGGVIAAPIWNKYMKEVLGDTPFENFKTPNIQKTNKTILDGEIEGLKTIKVDKVSGLLATEHTPTNLIEEIPVTEHHSILYYIDIDDPLGPKPKNPEKDPQFVLWESRVVEWANRIASTSISTLPTEFDNLHNPEHSPKLTILSPNNKQIVIAPQFRTNIKTTAPRGINHVNYYLNNNLLTTIKNHPFNLSTSLSFLPNGFHTLEIEACDDVLNCTKKSVEINLSLENNPQKTASVAWLSPSNGIAVSNFDFPLKLDINVTNNRNIAKIDFFAGTSSSYLLGSISPIKSKLSEYVWQAAPTSGSYKIKAVATLWTGKIISTDEIIININNTSN